MGELPEVGFVPVVLLGDRPFPRASFRGRQVISGQVNDLALTF